MIQTLPPEIFKNLAEENRTQELIYQKKCSQVGWLRLGLFIAGVSTVIYFFRQDLEPAAWVSLLVFYIIFIVVLRW
ncbi:MAG: hypothetical protein M3Q05_09560, partial [Bacteroidota bacterium]|nr:hypothetical protein [Bacteroidota bacterium]